ncbi:MAG: replication-associated recombination protein A [Ignavibacteriaceae bacterium]|nr:replication-associated recombination protein A [Ignavibacteriaceae bacterium]
MPVKNSKPRNKNIEFPPVPLAERVRPRSLDEFRGQQHLLGEGKPIRVMMDKDAIGSFIMWGPPGSGKTTIARLIAKKTGSNFHQLNAVSGGVRDLRAIFELAAEAKLNGEKTILFIDEVHRFNKMQQDALLGAVESGLVTLIGATTENPSFEVIPALRSRARIFVLNSLEKEELEEIIKFALTEDEFLRTFKVKNIDTEYLIYASGGDARILLNLLEAALILESDKDEINIDKGVIENCIQQKVLQYDKGGEEHYNIISAFIKSLRGSDPDAALYWMARMIEGGEDPLFIARRMLVFASEDIGNASPNALVLAEACFSAVDKVGMPEGRIILAQCATYLAGSPKSNSSYMGIEKAIGDVRNNPAYPVPLHLRNAPTKLMKNLGYSKGYKYPHEFDKHFIDENYLPEEMKGKQYYFPSTSGQEKAIRDRLAELWKHKKKYNN